MIHLKYKQMHLERSNSVISCCKFGERLLAIFAEVENRNDVIAIHSCPWKQWAADERQAI